jgi:hypothetical protein
MAQPWMTTAENKIALPLRSPSLAKPHAQKFTNVLSTKIIF